MRDGGGAPSGCSAALPQGMHGGQPGMGGARDASDAAGARQAGRDTRHAPPVLPAPQAAPAATSRQHAPTGRPQRLTCA